eukprot:scaffold1097_cov67-Phaeocystis_antarctica.AAC.4
MAAYRERLAAARRRERLHGSSRHRPDVCLRSRLLCRRHGRYSRETPGRGCRRSCHRCSHRRSRLRAGRATPLPHRTEQRGRPFKLGLLFRELSCGPSERRLVAPIAATESLRTPWSSDVQTDQLGHHTQGKLFRHRAHSVRLIRCLHHLGDEANRQGARLGIGDVLGEPMGLLPKGRAAVQPHSAQGLDRCALHFSVRACILRAEFVKYRGRSEVQGP